MKQTGKREFSHNRFFFTQRHDLASHNFSQTKVTSPIESPIGYRNDGFTAQTQTYYSLVVIMGRFHGKIKIKVKRCRLLKYG